MKQARHAAREKLALLIQIRTEPARREGKGRNERRGRILDVFNRGVRQRARAAAATAKGEFESVVLALFGLATASVLLAGACSLTLDTSTTQCQSDQDCQRFAGAICDAIHRVCLAPRDASTGTANLDLAADAAQTCTGPNGCFSCTPNDESQILSHCTDSTCVPFDNKRLTLWGDYGGPRPLPQ